jgi:hypothetical protein
MIDFRLTMNLSELSVNVMCQNHKNELSETIMCQNVIQVQIEASRETKDAEHFTD